MPFFSDRVAYFVHEYLHGAAARQPKDSQSRWGQRAPHLHFARLRWTVALAWMALALLFAVASQSAFGALHSPLPGLLTAAISVALSLAVWAMPTRLSVLGLSAAVGSVVLLWLSLLVLMPAAAHAVGTHFVGALFAGAAAGGSLLMLVGRRQRDD